jgi:hypothetical protein
LLLVSVPFRLQFHYIFSGISNFQGCHHRKNPEKLEQLIFLMPCPFGQASENKEPPFNLMGKPFKHGKKARNKWGFSSLGK